MLRAIRSSWLLPALALGCGGKDSDHSHSELHQPAVVSLTVTSLTRPDPPQVDLFVDRVELKSSKGWVPLATVRRVLDLQHLTEDSARLVTGLDLARSDYSQLRLVVDPERSAVTEPDGQRRPLHLPEALRPGIVVDLASSTRRRQARYDFILAVDLPRSLQLAETGGGTYRYTFRPALSLQERSSTGCATGQVVNEQRQPLAQVWVSAQQSSQSGPILVHSVLTGADGTYRLDLLPLERTYQIVASPTDGGYAAAAGAPFTPTEQGRGAAFDFSLKATTLGQVMLGMITQPVRPNQHDQLDLLQNLSGGSFLVRTRLAIPAPDGATSRVDFGPLPPGDYQVRRTRFHLDPQGHTSTASEPPKACSVRVEGQTWVEL